MPKLFFYLDITYCALSVLIAESSYLRNNHQNDTDWAPEIGESVQGKGINSWIGAYRKGG